MQSGGGPLVSRRMRPLLLAAPLLLASSAFAARVTESRAVSGFTELDVSGGVEVFITKGPFALTLEGEAGELERFATTVSGGRLTIERKGFGFSFGHSLTARVSMPALTRLNTSGGVAATFSDVAAKELTLDLSGGGSVRASGLDLETLVLDASGGVDAKLAGKTKKLVADLSGGVDVEAKQLVVTAAVIDASGGCSVELNVKGGVKGSASGGTHVRVLGKPTAAAIETSGAADVEYVH